MNEMPLMGFGTFIGIEADRIDNKVDRDNATSTAIFSALAQGYRHLDLAENYGNLSAVKTALHEAFKPVSEGGLGLAREDIWLTMKAVGPYNDRHISSLLHDVGVGYFDLFLIHNPTFQGLFDDRDSLVTGWRNLSNISNTRLQRIGVSNFYEPHLQRLMEVCETEHLPKPYVNQIQMNPWTKEPGVVTICQEHDVRLMAYSPLGYGYSEFLLQDERLQAVATELDVTPAQVALAWLMKQRVAVIPKSTHEERLIENFQAQSIVTRLTPEQMAVIDSAIAPDYLTDIVLSGTADAAKQDGDNLSWEPFHTAGMGLNR